MGEDDRTLINPVFAIGVKRSIINDNDGFYRESKRQCTQSFEHNHDYDGATNSSCILSSREAQDGFFNGSGNTLYQPNVDTDLPGYVEPQYSPGLPLLSEEIGEPMSQSSGIITSEPIGQVVRNENTYLGQPIDVH